MTNLIQESTRVLGLTKEAASETLTCDVKILGSKGTSLKGQISGQHPDADYFELTSGGKILAEIYSGKKFATKKLINVAIRQEKGKYNDCKMLVMEFNALTGTEVVIKDKSGKTVVEFYLGDA